MTPPDRERESEAVRADGELGTECLVRVRCDLDLPSVAWRVEGAPVATPRGVPEAARDLGRARVSAPRSARQ